jgi:hypothetical protein
LAPGDMLSMFVRGNDSMFVYVLDEDTKGAVFWLFPLKNLALANPLEGRVQHRLPGDLGREVHYWTVTSAGGRETIMAIGSRAPIVELEKALAGVPSARVGEPVQLDPMALRSLRGIGGGTALPPPKGEAKRRLDATLQGLEARGKETGDVWVWSIELRNPAP